MSDEAIGLFKLTLDHEIYEKYQGLFLDEMFPRPLDKLWQVIKSAHAEYKRDLSTAEVYALVVVKNGTLTTAMKNSLKDVLDRVEGLPEIGSDVALEVIKAAHRHELGRTIIEESYGLIENKAFDIHKVQACIDQVSNGVLPSKDGLKQVSTDIEELLKDIDSGPGWSFNLNSLHEKIPLVRAGEFAVIFARPELGKSALWISLACGPGGWCEQGAHVHVWANEEFAKRHMMRAISCASTMTADEIRENIGLASKRSEIVRERLHLYDALDMTIEDIDAFCAENQVDVGIVDQLDKCRTNGPKDQANHERLGDIYTNFREVCKRRNMFGVGISQASNDAQGKDLIDFSMLEGSKTRKAAECDYAIGVGHNSIIEQAGGDNNVNFRLITVSKNKGTGWHGSVAARLDPLRTRYIDCDQAQ